MQRALIIFLFGMACIPFGDTANKLLTTDHGVDPIFSAWARFAIGTLAVVPFLPRGALRVFKRPLVLFRGALFAGGISSITIALSQIPLSTAFGGLFFAPVVSFLTAVIFLKERAPLSRWVLVGLAFGGVLLVTQPWTAASAGLAWAFLAGTFYGTFLTTSRALADEDPIAVLFTQVAIAGALTLPFAIMMWPGFNVAKAGLFAWSGLASLAGNFCVIFAYGLIAANRLAPWVNFQLVFAFAFSWIFFDHKADVVAWFGLAIIIAAGFASNFSRD